MSKTKSEMTLDFQAWAKPKGYAFSGILDAWIGAYEFYKVDELLEIKERYEEKCRKEDSEKSKAESEKE